MSLRSGKPGIVSMLNLKQDLKQLGNIMPKVIQGKFYRQHLDELQEEIEDLLQKYEGRISIAEVLGMIEAIKLDIWDRYAKRNDDD